MQIFETSNADGGRNGLIYEVDNGFVLRCGGLVLDFGCLDGLNGCSDGLRGGRSLDLCVDVGRGRRKSGRLRGPTEK